MQGRRLDVLVHLLWRCYYALSVIIIVRVIISQVSHLIKFHLEDLSYFQVPGVEDNGAEEPLHDRDETAVCGQAKPTLVMWHIPGSQDCEKLTDKLLTAMDLVDELDLVKVDVNNSKELAMSRGLVQPRCHDHCHGQGRGAGWCNDRSSE